MPLTPERQRYYRHRKALVVWEYLESHPCVDCGEANPVVLDFDHVHGEKRAGVKRMLAGTHSLAVVLAEIAKCEVRCANCHRRITAKRGGFFAYLDNPAPPPPSTRRYAACGTRGAYRRGCRCEPCKTAHRDYNRTWKAGRKP